MKNLEARIIKLESAKSDPINNFFYEIACRFAGKQGKPLPKKQNDIVMTMRQLAGVLPL